MDPRLTLSSCIIFSFQDFNLRSTDRWWTIQLIGMLFRLLIVSAVLCHVQAVLSRPPCRRPRLVCGENAECHDKSCGCKEGFFGQPLIECHRSDQFQCVVQGGPHYSTFSKNSANLFFPCKYRMARVQTPLERGVAGLAFCSFEVFGFNEIINGRYYTSGVEISLAIGDFANQFFKQQDFIKFDINQLAVETSDGSIAMWGHDASSKFNGIEVECKFDTHHRFAILSIPRCQFSVKFRPYNDADTNIRQSQVPGISIVVGQQTIFGESDLGRYPSSLCGVPGDGSHLFQDRASELRLKNRHQALLYDALDQNLTQESFLEEVTDSVLQDKDTCQATVDEFLECGTQEQKSKAIRLCFNVLSKRRFTKCLGISALSAFRACVEAFCSDRAEGCEKYFEVLGNLDCKGPRKVKKFCH
ncbi:uncharacterized protein LOC143277209 [Babylonia areolata]|uniref:uncharacterized protein LOC143277209 n=1 Tax=Babylonia areolata TaxID=304850 RepID=UPI003FD5FDD3